MLLDNKILTLSKILEKLTLQTCNELARFVFDKKKEKYNQIESIFV